eukprot:764588-Hanusia_phi.AAC.1
MRHTVQVRSDRQFPQMTKPSSNGRWIILWPFEHGRINAGEAAAGEGRGGEGKVRRREGADEQHGAGMARETVRVCER